MAEKDITEKMLEDYNDVFCDIVNVFLFDGKRLMKEEELENLKTKSQLKLSNDIHEQERDVAKRWLKNNIRFALVGIENQTSIDNTAALRIMSYDGASYKEQLAEIDGLLRQKKKAPKLVPVITFIIYFGEDKWKKKSLYDVLEIPDYLKKYVNDYKINIFDIKDLTYDQVELFKSDFRVVADYFYKKYHCKEYVPDPITIKHVDAVLKLMTALTGDQRFEQAINELPEGKKEEFNMCEFIDKAEVRGEARGEARGRTLNLIRLIKKKYDKDISAEETAEIFEEDYDLVDRIYRAIDELGDKYTENGVLEKINADLIVK
ncbi:MAG: Rpn family recombination-promoting nuclease/putative transposase [Lachnospiraceae bacterium]|nr:Rpn family recombination-promoting nuclease/putative transposase [Lachnospiraceae bacterium]